MSPLTGLFANAAQAAEKKDAHATFEALLAAWAQKPHPSVGAAVLAAEEMFPGKSFTGPLAAWLEAARLARPAERGGLIATATTPRLEESVDRLAVVAQWVPDPRVSKLVEGLLRDPKWTSDSSKRLWGQVLKLMVAAKDPALRAVAAAAPEHWGMRESMVKWLGNALRKHVVEVREDAAPLTSEESTALSGLRAVLVPAVTPAPKNRTEADLLAAVFARPEDDAPRLVFADFLLEKNDPRGDFIARQIKEPTATPAGTKERAWLGALAPVLKDRFSFRRGFLSAGVVGFRHRLDVEQYGALPEWATVEELEWDRKGQLPWAGFIGPAMRRLKRATWPATSFLLEAKEPWALEFVDLFLDGVEELRAVTDAGLLPRATEVGVWGTKLSPLWFDKLKWGVVRRLRIHSSLPAPFLERPWDAPVEQLSFVSYGTWEFTRGTDGRFSRLKVLLPPSDRSTWLLHWAQSLPDGCLEHLEFPPSKVEGMAAVEAMLRTKIGRPSAAVSRAGFELRGRLGAVGWSAEGWLFCLDDRVAVVDPKTQRVLREFPVEGESFAFSPNGAWLLAQFYGRASVYEVATGERVAQLPTKGKQPKPGAVSDDGQRAVLNWGKSSELWDVKAKTLLHSANHGEGPVSLDPAAGRWAATGKWNHVKGTILIDPAKIYEPGKRKGLPLAGTAEVTKALLFLDGRVVSGGHIPLGACDAVTGERSVEGKLENVQRLTASASRTRIAVETNDSGTTRQHVLDAETLKPIASLKHGDYGSHAFCFSPDASQLLVVAGFRQPDQSVKLGFGAYDAVTGEPHPAG